MSRERHWPRISVVTACFNAAEFVSRTVESVVGQHYPDLEYLFVDAASTDDTLTLVRQYEGRGITALISEPDDGQYHGIQKGMGRATGDVMGWLNGDDVYCPWTLATVGEVFAQMPEVEWIIGTPSYMNAAGQCVRVSGTSGSAYPRDFIRNGWFRAELGGYLQQESMFWRRSLWDKVGGLDLSLNLAADFDLWRRFAEHAELYSINVPLALFRQRPGQQRSSAAKDLYEAEVLRVASALPRAPIWWRWLAARGESGRHLARMAVWREAPVIAYSYRHQRWVTRRSWRPLARTSWADLLLERSLRSVRS